MLSLLAALALAAPVPKNPPPKLKWRFAKGDTFYVTTAVDASMAVNAGGGGIPAQNNTSSGVYVYKATVTAAEDKSTSLEVEFLSCMSGTGNGGGAAKLTDQEGVVGKKITFTLDPSNKVTKADGKALDGVGGGMLSADFVKGQVQDLLRAVPGKTLAKGDTWKGEEEAALAEGVTMKRADRGTVAGTYDELTKLEVETDNAMSGGPKGGPALDLKGEKGKRTVLFDAKAGRVRKLNEEYTVSGNIALGGGGGGRVWAPQAINLTMTMKATVTVSDKEPKKDEK